MKRKSESRRTLRDLAAFRYRLRKFLRFSEEAATQSGLTAHQHQLLLGVAGFTPNGHATITELAEFLQERHHSVVELVGRAVKRGLVRKAHDPEDRRRVFVSLTPTGEALLAKLSAIHRREVVRLQGDLIASLHDLRSRTIRATNTSGQRAKRNS